METSFMSQADLLASLGADTEGVPDNATKGELATPSNHYTPGVSSGIEERALSLLGMGIHSDSVASALGVTPARISQLLAEKSFADKVAKLRYENLQKHNRRDTQYDDMEDKLLTKLNKALPLMVKPDTILKAINVINNAKRRGQSAPDTSSNTQNVVNLILPNAVASKFVTNINNQVTKAGDQELLTMPSGNLLKQVERAQEAIEHKPNSENNEESSNVQDQSS